MYAPPCGPMIPPMTSLISHKLESIDDRHIASKHREIYPRDSELSNVQRHVFNVEKALKLMSESINSIEIISKGKSNDESGLGTEMKSSNTSFAGGNLETKDKNQSLMEKEQIKAARNSSEQCLKGVARVGILAKGLMLHGDDVVDLVVICKAKPNIQLLECVSSNISTFLEKVVSSNESNSGSSKILEKQSTNFSYSVEKYVEDASIHVIVSTDITKEEDEYIENSCNLTIRLRFTSPLMRKNNEEEEDEKEVLGDEGTETCSIAPLEEDSNTLDIKSCLESLAELRHAKWFQVIIVFYLNHLNPKELNDSKQTND